MFDRLKDTDPELSEDPVIAGGRLSWVFGG